MAMLRMARGQLSFDTESGTLARIEFEPMELVFENHCTRNIVKANLNHLRVYCPQHYGSPFFTLFCPLEASDFADVVSHDATPRRGQRPNAQVRWEKQHPAEHPVRPPAPILGIPYGQVWNARII
jgi:hypothetical protein